MTGERISSPCLVERADVSAALSHLSEHLGRRLAQDGLAGAGADVRAVRQAINDRDHRLRCALGERPDAPTPQPLPA